MTRIKEVHATSQPSANLNDRTDPVESVQLIQGANWRQRLVETLWALVGQQLFRWSFHDWYRLRTAMLRLFGADIHPTARIRPSARISHPWLLKVGAHTAIGDHAIIFCLGPIDIGARCTISQYTHICSASHDHTRADMALIMDPIRIEDDAWIAADVFIGPGVTIGADTVVGARSTVMHSLPPGSVCAGDNAKILGERKIRVG